MHPRDAQFTPEERERGQRTLQLGGRPGPVITEEGVAELNKHAGKELFVYDNPWKGDPMGMKKETFDKAAAKRKADDDSGKYDDPGKDVDYGSAHFYNEPPVDYRDR